MLDRAYRVAYACWSPTDAGLLAAFGERLGYTVLGFDAVGPDGQAIYHTNVLMNVGVGFAVICTQALPDPGQRAAVLASLVASGHAIVDLRADQLANFAGNMLALENQAGEQILAMSSRALASLDPAQREALARHARLVSAPIPTIEDQAGGSVRCMLAEIFLPPDAL